MMKRYYSVFLLYSFFVSCSTEKTNEKPVEQNSEQVLHASIANDLRIRYEEFIIEDLNYGNEVKRQRVDFGEALRALRMDTEQNSLILVTSIHDCSTCIDKIFTKIMEHFNVEMISKNVVLLTDELNITNLEAGWGKMLHFMNVKVYPLDTLYSKFSYKSGQPYFLLYDSYQQHVSSFLKIDQRFPSLNERFVLNTKTILLDKDKGIEDKKGKYE